MAWFGLDSRVSPYLHYCYYCAIAKDRLWSDSTGFMSYAGLLAGQSDYRNRCLWLMNPFACGHKVEIILLFAYCSLQTPQTLWKCVGTAKPKHRSTRSRKHSTNVFSSEGTSVKGVVVTCVYRPENEPGSRYSPENAVVGSLQLSDVCKCWVCQNTRCHLQIAVNDITFSHTMFTRKSVKSDQTLSFAIAQ